MSDHINERVLLDGLDEGVLLAAKTVLELAKRNAPIGGPEDENRGALRESGHLERDGTLVQIVFDVPYAAKQHEDLRLRHPHGGGPKFLESALKTLAPKLEQAVAGQIVSRQKRGIFAGGRRV